MKYPLGGTLAGKGIYLLLGALGVGSAIPERVGLDGHAAVCGGERPLVLLLAGEPFFEPANDRYQVSMLGRFFP